MGSCEHDFLFNLEIKVLTSSSVTRWNESKQEVRGTKSAGWNSSDVLTSDAAASNLARLTSIF